MGVHCRCTGGSARLLSARVTNHVLSHSGPYFIGFYSLWLLAMLTNRCVVDANSKHSLFLYIETENKTISAH